MRSVPGKLNCRVTKIKFLDTFREAKNGNERLQKVLERYNAMIVAKKKKDRVNKFLINELVRFSTTF